MASGTDFLKRAAASAWCQLRIFSHAQWFYLLHVLALIRPGAPVPTFRAHQIAAQPLTGWSDDELQLMVDEGRRQADRQLADLEQIRGRAQWLFTVGVPIVTATGAVLAAIGDGESGWWKVAWVASLLLAGYGVVGAAAIMTIRADFNEIDSAACQRLQAANPRQARRRLRRDARPRRGHRRNQADRLPTSSRLADHRRLRRPYHLVGCPVAALNGQIEGIQRLLTIRPSTGSSAPTPACLRARRSVSSSTSAHSSGCGSSHGMTT